MTIPGFLPGFPGFQDRPAAGPKVTKVTFRVFRGQKQAYSQAGIQVPGPIMTSLLNIGAFWTTFARNIPLLRTFTPSCVTFGPIPSLLPLFRPDSVTFATIQARFCHFEPDSVLLGPIPGFQELPGPDSRSPGGVPEVSRSGPRGVQERAQRCPRGGVPGCTTPALVYSACTTLPYVHPLYMRPSGAVPTRVYTTRAVSGAVLGLPPLQDPVFLAG